MGKAANANTTADFDYVGGRRDLHRAILLAEDGVHDALFREHTGAGSEGETEAAKEHLASLRARLEDHEALQVGLEAAERRQRVRETQAGYAAWAAQAEALLTERMGCVTQAVAAAETLARAVQRYREINDRIVETAPPSPAKYGQLIGALRLNMAFDVSQIAASDVLSAARFVVTPNNALNPVTPMENEDYFARAIRHQIQSYTPGEE